MIKFALLCLAALFASAYALYPTAYLTDSSAIAYELFGETVAISGSLVAVGAPQRGSNNQGAVLLYNCPTLATCTLAATVVAPDAADEDQFGFSVALDGSTLIVGAPFKTVNGNQFEGSAYIFSCTISGCNTGTAITQSSGSGAAFDDFGTAVGVSGDLVVIGCDQKTVNSNVGQGSVFVYTCPGGSCSYYDTIQCPDCSGGGENFGKALAVDGNLVAIGAPFRTVNENGQQGEGYVFDCSSQPCGGVGMAIAADGGSGDNLGTAVGISGSTAVFGAPSANASTDFTGAAYIFTVGANSLTFEEKLWAADGATDDNYGFSVAVQGPRIIVGANLHKVGTVNATGTAYLYDCTTSLTSCTLLAELSVTGAPTGENVGFAVDLDNTVLGLVVGAPYHSTSSNPQIGRVALYPQGALSCAAVTYDHASYPAVASGVTSHGSCGTGYYGSPTRVCTNGQFGAETNPCQQSPGCPAQVYGYFNWTAGTVGQYSNGTCISGYFSSGTPGSRQCLASGWSSLVTGGTCTAGCAAVIDNDASWPSTALGVSVYGTCVPGYYGRPYRTCMTGGVFGSITNPCTQISGSDCPAGVVSLGTSFGATAPLTTATGTCLANYVPYTGSGSPTRLCEGNGQWAADVTNICVATTCPATTANGATFAQTNHGSTAKGTCDGVGTVTMYCAVTSPTTAAWQTPVGTCTP